MQESKRQKQVGALLLQELSDIFQRMGLGMMDGGLVSITGVKMTPDLLEARVYLSFFQVKDQVGALKKVEEAGWEIKRELATRVKQQLRRIPVLQYFLDDSQEHASKMDELFKKISEGGKADEGSQADESKKVDKPKKEDRGTRKGSSEKTRKAGQMKDGGSAPRDGASGM